MAVSTKAAECTAAQAIAQIHRGGGYVTLHRIRDGEFENICAVELAQLADQFPLIQPLLERDSFVSINSMFRAGRGRSKLAPTLPNPHRDNDSLSYLNAVFADCDCHRLGITPIEATARVYQLVAERVLPLPSIVVRSGRGIWVLWLLRDAADVAMPPRAWPEAMDLWQRIQLRVHERLSMLGADAFDAARLIRIPQSINSKSDTEVRYTIEFDASGTTPLYTLDEIAALVGLRCDQRRDDESDAIGAEQRIVNERLSAQGKRGNRIRRARQLAQFEKLRELRGGFSEGCRNRAAVLYAAILRSNNIPWKEITEAVHQLGSECVPPLTNSEIRAALRTGRRMRSGPMSISNQKISNWLEITRAESEALTACGGGADKCWPQAMMFRDAVIIVPKPTRADVRAARQRAIRHIILSTGGEVPSTREIARLLNQEFGIKASHVSVRNDLRRLQLAP